MPFHTARLSAEVIDLATIAVEKGNINSVTDAGVGAHIAYTGVKGGIFNVLINLNQIEDQKYIKDMILACKDLDQMSREKVDAVMEQVNKKIEQLMKKRADGIDSNAE